MEDSVYRGGNGHGPEPEPDPEEQAATDADSQPEAGASAEHPLSWSALQTLGQYLEDDGWHPTAVEGKHAYRTYYSGRNGEMRCYAQILIDLEQFVFYVVAMLKVPEDARVAAAEYITRANYGLRIGNLEMDFSDGEVRFKGSVDFEGLELSPQLIRNTVYPAVQTMDRYLPGLLKVAFGGKTPVEAIAEVEGRKS